MPGWMQWTVALLVGMGIIVVGFRYAGPVLITFFVINCLVLIIVVLLQSGKAADLAGAFGGAGSQTAFGPRGAANVLSRATTWCAIMFMLCAMALVLRTDRGVVQGGSVLQNVAQPKAAAPVTTKPAAPVTPVPSPATTAPGASQPGSSSPVSQQPPNVPSTPSSKPVAPAPASTPAPKKQ
jgi:preprotein translocase subunit SecG